MQSHSHSTPGAMNLKHLDESGLNAIDLICGAIARPLDLVLRPWHGTRTHPLNVVALSSAIMLVLPALLAMYDGLLSLIPFTHPQASPGMFGLGSFAELFYLLSVAHGVRLYRRVTHMNSELHSTFEGRGLPIFDLSPWCRSFHATRIVLEPLFVILLSIVLQDLFLIQASLANYLRVAALALCLRALVSWYRAWQYVRDVLDAKNAGPILARLADDQASDEELATINLCAFLRDVDPAIRAEAVVSIARAYSGNE